MGGGRKGGGGGRPSSGGGGARVRHRNGLLCTIKNQMAGAMV